MSPHGLCALISSVFCFPASTSWGFIRQDHFLAQGHRSSFNLLDVSMPGEPRILAPKAKSISLSAQCLCSNILQTPPAKIFMLYSWEMLRVRHGRTRRDTACGLILNRNTAARITKALDLCFNLVFIKCCWVSGANWARFFSFSSCLVGSVKITGVNVIARWITSCGTRTFFSISTRAREAAPLIVPSTWHEGGQVIPEAFSVIFVENLLASWQKWLNRMLGQTKD